MNLKKAMEIRTSSRHYLGQPVAREQAEKLFALARELSSASGLNFHVVLESGEPFRGIRRSYGLLSGVRNYLLIAGKPGMPDFLEKAGYYGERWLLEATMLGLGTCWVGGSYDKRALDIKLDPEEEPALVIVFGHTPEREPFKDRLLKKAMHRKSKGVEELLNTNGVPPNWVLEGMKYVALAPSAAHRQPVRFTCSGDSVMASVPGKMNFEWVDLGIAKFHFQTGVGTGRWTWGNHGKYTHSLE